jgi:hypothetical protein
MKDGRCRRISPLIPILIAIGLLAPGVAYSQQATLLQTGSTIVSPTTRNVVIIGFVGGFVSQKDTKHPEVQFAAYLRDRYPTIHAEVFGNHHGQKALHQVVHLLDANHDGVLSSLEKNQATVIIYGHSWGATETVEFASELGRMNIPVALTIQVDIIHKPGHRASAIPANVATAINFYQTKGPLHGQPEIVAADPTQTKILGNIRMSYEDRPIDCDNYSWYSRTLNKSHHEIENDFRVWDKLASLIDANLPGTASIVRPLPPSASPFFQYLRRGFQARGTESTMLTSDGKGN